MAKKLRTKKVPQRTCIACKQVLPKKELIRIVKSDGDVSVDLTHRANGRGAYICHNLDCLNVIMKKNSLSVALGNGVTENQKEQIQKQVKKLLSGSLQEEAMIS